MRAIAIDPKHAVGGTDPGPAPMLQWLAIADLVVDDSYQRDLQRANWTAIRKIAAVFKWSRFSPVFVAPVEGGRYAIIDGQHRTHAAALCGFETVPCQIVQMTHAEQAASFAAVNGLVTKVTLFQIYKAALAAGDKWAVQCARVCEDAGCRLMTFHPSAGEKKAGHVFAISLIRHFVDRGLAAETTFALSGLRRSEMGREAGGWSHEVLKPLLLAVTDRPWLAKQQVDLSGFLDRFDMYAAIDRAEQYAKERRRSGQLDVTKFDLVSASIGEAMDKAFPQRMTVPKAVA